MKTIITLIALLTLTSCAPIPHYYPNQRPYYAPPAAVVVPVYDPYYSPYVPNYRYPQPAYPYK